MGALGLTVSEWRSKEEGRIQPDPEPQFPLLVVKIAITVVFSDGQENMPANLGKALNTVPVGS